MGTVAGAPAIARPGLLLLGAEPFRAAKEFASHLLTSDDPAPNGDGHPVVIFPGLGTNERALAPLLKHCRKLGYTPMDWGGGYNTGPKGDVEVWVQQLARRTAELLSPYRKRATLIGWSLGGLYARELAKLLPGKVRQVITIGTPFNASGGHTNVGWLFRVLNGKTRTADPQLSARLRVPPPVPTTSIYSRSDGIVAWETCLHDAATPRSEDIEIGGSHIGMGWNPAVMRVVADRLAQRPGSWKPYAH